MWRARSPAENARERAAVELDAAFGRQQPGERPHQRGLAGAVGTDERGELAGFELERGAIDDQRAGEIAPKHPRRAASVRRQRPRSRRRSFEQPPLGKDHRQEERHADQRGDDADPQLVGRRQRPHRDVGDASAAPRRQARPAAARAPDRSRPRGAPDAAPPARRSRSSRRPPPRRRRRARPRRPPSSARGRGRRRARPPRPRPA